MLALGLFMSVAMPMPEQVRAAQQKIDPIETMIIEGKFTAATRQIDTGLASGRDIPRWCRLKALLLAYGGSAEALPFAMRALSSKPHARETLETAALVHSALGRDSDAVTLAKRLIETDKQNQIAFAVLAHHYAEKRDITRALSYQSKVLDEKNPSFHALYKVALDLEKTSQLEKAVNALNKLVDTYPRSSTAWTLRGQFYRRLDSRERAMKDFREAYRLSPENIGAAVMIAKVLSNEKRFEEALPYYDKFIESGAPVASAFSKRGDCHRHLGHLDKAIEDYDRALDILTPKGSESIRGKSIARLAPNYTRLFKTIWIVRAQAYYEKGDSAKALTELGEFIETFPKDSSARYIRYQMLRKDRSYAKALMDIGYLVDQYPDIKKWRKEQAELCKIIEKEKRSRSVPRR